MKNLMIVFLWLAASVGYGQVVFTKAPPSMTVALTSDGGATYEPMTGASGEGMIWTSPPPPFVPVCTSDGGATFSQCTFSGGGGGGCTGPTGNFDASGQVITLTDGCVSAIGNPFSMSISCSAAGNFELGFASTNPNNCTFGYSNGTPASGTLGDGTHTTTLVTPFTSGALAFSYTSNTTFTGNATATNAENASASDSFTVNDCTFAGVGNSGATGATASGSGSCLSGETATITGAGSTIPAVKLGNTTAGESFTLTPSDQFIILLLTGGCGHTITVNTFTTTFTTQAVTYTNILGGSQTGMCIYTGPTSLTGTFSVVVSTL